MKLLIYSHFFAPSIGGVETIVLSLARGLAELREANGAPEFEITLATQTPAGNHDDRALPFSVVRRPTRRKLWQLIREQNKVLLAGPAILPLAFSLLCGKNTVLTHHGYQATCPNGMLFQFAPQTNCPGHFAAARYVECLRCNAAQHGWAVSLKLLLLTFLRRSLARRAGTNVGVSEHVAGRLALPGVHVIRNAVAETGASNTPWAQDPQAVRFAYIGRLVTEKGTKILLEAAALLASRGLTPSILIIGDGPERAALEREKTLLKLGDNVTFLGFQRGLALEDQMRQISVLIMPSLCEEVAPLSALEMMMQGRPIICSRVGGLAEQVGEGGLMFAPGDAQGLAQRMSDVLEHPSVLTTLGKRARERAVSQYNLQRMVAEYRTLLSASAK